MRAGGIEITPGMEMIILKEAELAYKSGYADGLNYKSDNLK